MRRGTDQSVNVIETTKLSKSLGSRVAVTDLDLAVKSGELFSLLGPNAAGKTTTIKMLCCLMAPTSGTASVLGHDIRADPLAVKKVIGVAPQETAVAPNLTAWENLEFIAGLHGIDAKHTRARATELLEVTGLVSRANDKAKKFSGGMQRRLSIAMALVADPQIVFLDEPTIGLDPQSRKVMWEYIANLKGRTTIVLTTHYLEEADALADRVAVIDHGSLVALGAPDELKAQVAGVPVTVIEATNLGPDALAALQAIYPSARPVDGGAEIEADNVSVYDVGDCLRRFDVEVRGVAVKQVTLDDVFIKLTGSAIRE